MAIRGVMETLPGVPFYWYIENLSAKPVSLPKHMIVEQATSNLPHVMHAQSDKLKPDSTNLCK